jgi:hypothetical protein
VVKVDNEREEEETSISEHEPIAPVDNVVQELGETQNSDPLVTDEGIVVEQPKVKRIYYNYMTISRSTNNLYKY